ncbi:basal-body rod modification protein FlgD [Sulfuriferula plumbiphila]|uniref:Basal-body rod modification protein FlgD n=1 Tax=Sulfuriferula plumbiphila TaxID=171865 RepID=A0A512L4E5_9PROT|nr:flagellar hook assembly protein FlgD [Sulfuriferula plumbiphila]BBP03824.1 basal-body rod modification protein FlgD [Sulfuriferula plumbiphila]GEP29347.1 basal-body rod modification protein FlgD [Sulfuriferula plumbiphila]
MNTVQNNTVSPSLLAAMNPAGAATQSSAAAAQDTFMKLLVTQMKNQDPLNPLDNAQVTSQLAQLSTVTGIEKMNTTLQSLIGSYQSSQALQAAGMIGHGVLVVGSSLNLSNGRAPFGIDLAGAADNVKVTILDASGRPVRSMNLGSQPAGMLPLQWDGRTDSGAAAAGGQYSFTVSATQAGQKVSADSLAFGQVASVASGSQGVVLNVPGLGPVNLIDIRQIL